MCRVALLVSLVSHCGLLGDLSKTHAAGRNPALATPDLLVDLARDYGLRCRGKQTPADAIHIRTLLRAALRLNPRQPQACLWLYELASRGDRPGEAAEMLAQLVAADPANTNALATWLETAPLDVQTVEQRHMWLDGLLDEQERPENRALVLTHLARLALQQADQQRARKHLDEALGLWPECPDALLLALELATPETPLAERLRAALAALRVNSLQVGLAWDVGLLLDEHGFAEEALGFYEHALAVQTLISPRGALPADKLLELSRNALARRQPDQALRYAQQAAAIEASSYEARFYLYWLLGGETQTPVREEFKSALAANFATIKEPARWPVEIVSQAAWFYCSIDEQPQRALRLAEEAAGRAPGDLFVMRVLGWAQALNGRAEQARQTLARIAKTDPYAAYRLAVLLRDAGDQDAPARVLQELTFVPPVGRARQLLDELGVPPLASRPAGQRFPDVLTVLAEFDRTVLSFHKEPARFLEAKVELDDSSPAPGEPWWVVCSLTNRGTFPITLGPDRMVNPVFLMSFHTEGDRKRDYPNLLTLTLGHARVISPGHTVRVRRTIDIGPLRKLSRRSPQHLQTISLTTILDPQQTPDGQWIASATGQPVHAVSFVRLPANTTPEAWQAWFSALRGESSSDRFHTLEVMAELLGENQRAALKPLTYRPQPIPAGRIHTALLNALASESWETRARALDALQVAGLDRALVDAAERCLEDPHWLVRMMALRLLARQGRAFAETAQRIADDDNDELVRALARSYVQRWSRSQPQPPTTQPKTP